MLSRKPNKRDKETNKSLSSEVLSGIRDFVIFWGIICIVLFVFKG